MNTKPSPELLAWLRSQDSYMNAERGVPALRQAEPLPNPARVITGGKG